MRRERELRGWSQAILADKIGSQPLQVTRWEKGASFPSPYYREKLCLLFARNAEELCLIKSQVNNSSQEQKFIPEVVLVDEQIEVSIISNVRAEGEHVFAKSVQPSSSQTSWHPDPITFLSRLSLVTYVISRFLSIKGYMKPKKMQ